MSIRRSGATVILTYYAKEVRVDRGSTDDFLICLGWISRIKGLYINIRYLNHRIRFEAFQNDLNIVKIGVLNMMMFRLVCIVLAVGVPNLKTKGRPV